MKEYTLTDAERATVDKLLKQRADVLEVIEQKQREAIAISGGIQAIGLVLASQNGLGDSVKFNGDFTKVIAA